MAESQEPQGPEAQVSEAQIAVHWREEESYRRRVRCVRLDDSGPLPSPFGLHASHVAHHHRVLVYVGGPRGSDGGPGSVVDHRDGREPAAQIEELADAEHRVGPPGGPEHEAPVLPGELPQSRMAALRVHQPPGQRPVGREQSLPPIRYS